MVHVLLLLLFGCSAQEIGTGSVVVSDSPECLLGLHATLQDNTTRTFDVADPAWFCLQRGGAGMRVQDGGSYVVRGGALGHE